jgi:hypothetical protein
MPFLCWDTAVTTQCLYSMKMDVTKSSSAEDKNTSLLNLTSTCRGLIRLVYPIRRDIRSFLEAYSPHQHHSIRLPIQLHLRSKKVGKSKNESQKVDVCPIRTDAPEGTRFQVLRDNHSANTPLCCMAIFRRGKYTYCVCADANRDKEGDTETNIRGTSFGWKVKRVGRGTRVGAVLGGKVHRLCYGKCRGKHDMRAGIFTGGGECAMCP